MDPYAPLPRFLGIVARTAHLFAMAVLVGAVWLDAPAAAVADWRVAAIGTGLLLVASEVSHDRRRWPWQASGVAVVVHAAALALLGVNGRVATGVALVVGAVGSHAPKRVRKWALVRGNGKREPGE